MSAKSTQRVTRNRALELLRSEFDRLSNDVLGDLLDVIADSGQSHRFSKLDNFVVSEFVEASRD